MTPQPTDGIKPEQVYRERDSRFERWVTVDAVNEHWIWVQTIGKRSRVTRIARSKFLDRFAGPTFVGASK